MILRLIKTIVLSRFYCRCKLFIQDFLLHVRKVLIMTSTVYVRINFNCVNLSLMAQLNICVINYSIRRNSRINFKN